MMQGSKSLENTIEDFRNRFATNGQFFLSRNDSIAEKCNAKVPNAPGVYIIFGGRRPLYIGKAGTIQQDGRPKKQGLRKRLRMKQGGISRAKFFRNVMADGRLSRLRFLWFVTLDEKNNIIPAFAEMELLQAHLERHGRLPDLNKSA